MTQEDPPTIWISQADVFDFLAGLEDESVDGVITDVPYPTTERYRAIGTTTRTKESTKSSNPWFSVMSIEELSRFLDALYVKMKPNAYAFIYVDEATSFLLAHHRGMIDDLARLNDIEKLRSGELKPTSRAPKDRTGFAWWTSFTWGKTTREDDGAEPDEGVKLSGGTGWHGAACTEKILVLEKGKSQLRTTILNLQLAARPAAPKGVKRASAKPEIIAERIARSIADPGSIIVDPFIGSGTHAIGITRAGCHALCNDIDASTFKAWMDARGVAYEEW